jgi:hypothetical protein
VSLGATREHAVDEVSHAAGELLGGRCPVG